MKTNCRIIVLMIFCFGNSAIHAQQRRVHIPSFPANSGYTSNSYNTNQPTACSIDTILLTTQAQIDNFTTNYPACTTPKYLIINGAGASPAITSLAGLSSITQIVKKLEIRNTSITSLSALNNITSIGDTLFLERNDLLTNTGLTNLTYLGAIYFKHLPALTSVAGLCNNFHKTGLIHIDSTNLSNLTGLHTIDTLTTPNGGLDIGYSPIINLSALNNLKYLEGYLRLFNNDLQTSIGLTNITKFAGFLIDGTPLLNSVAGLTNNLTIGNIGTFWFFNTGLPNLDGLEGITSAANFYISGNQSLTNINGLQNLSGSIGGGISIWGNSILTSIDPLKNITDVNGSAVEISYNYALTDLGGLRNVTDIDCGLWIQSNLALTSLDSLNPNLIIHNNLNYNGTYDSLRIVDNTLLTVCEALPICNYLNGGNPAEIGNNATGCNSISQITTACLSVNSYNDVENNCCIYNAIALNENIDKLGNVGRYDPVADDFVDQYDTYRIILPYPGSIKIFTEAKRDSCNADYLGVELLDKEGTPFPSSFLDLVNFNANPCSAVLNDSTRIAALTADTFYLRLQSNNQVRYKIRYQLIDTVTNDAEPNNIYVQAIPIAVSENKKGNLNYKKLAYSNYDFQDIYKSFLPGGGNVKVYIKSTYRGQTPLNFATYNEYFFTVNNAPGGGSFAVLPNGLAMSYGDVHYDTLSVCAVVGDTIYFAINSSQAFEYELKYEVVSAGLPPNDIEPNNNFVTATPIAYNEVKEGIVKGLAFTPSGITDFEDYYKAFLPKNGKLKVVFTGSNISCSNTNAATLELYRKNGTASAPIQPSYASADTLFYCSLVSDSVYFKIYATNAFSYSVSYEMTDTTTVNDVEPNNTIATAVPVEKGNIKKGTLSYKNNLFTDVNDYYRIIFTCSDTLKLTSVFTNQSCGLINNFFVGTAIRLYNKNGILINSKGIPNLNANQVYNDTTSFPINTPDTFYINYSQVDLGSNGSPLTYEFNVKNTAPAASFIITGVDSACLGTKIYKAENVCGTGLTYHWSLSSGGSLTAVDSIATVNWTTPGTHTVSLYLSNAFGNSTTKQYVVNVIPPIPAVAPTITANGRTLKSTIAPPGVGYQWFKTGVAINGANDSTYFAADSGTYVVRYKNYCGISSASNPIYFALPIIPQTITFNPLTPDITYAPNAFVITRATASSNLQVNYSIVSGPAVLNLDSVKVTGAGTIVIAANQAGNINYYAAPTKYDTIQVFQATQTINFPGIPNKKYSDTTFTLNATSDAGLPITYSIVSGNVSLVGNVVIMSGAGNVTIQAIQNGNGNYAAAVPVSQSFCIGVRALSTIQGATEPCFGTYTYTTKKIVGANYVWTLSSGGTLTFNNDTATVVWNTLGTHTLTVKANSSCDAVFGTTYTLTTNPTNSAPTVVSNMLPANNTIDLQLPLTISWIPGQFSVNYDIFIWRSDTLQPATPFATNINGVTYTIPPAGLAYNKTYKWRVISKNPCFQTAGPIQQFSLIPLPDLQVQNVQAPLTAFTGQNITINWTVKNIGPGRTNTNQNWIDAIYFSYDSANAFVVPPNTTPIAWNASNRTLLIGTKQNLTALDSGQQYTSTFNYTLPLNAILPTYVYVITNASNTILEVTRVNDTAKAPQPIAVTISPAPDLRVDSVFASNTTFSGSTLNVTYKVKNYGANTPVNSFWRDKIYISNTALFNINNATELKAPKVNGTYYYNAPAVQITNNAILQTDSSYIKLQQVIIPNFINGTYFIHVVTNTENQLYEGTATTNNIGNKQIQVLITPTPKLQVATLNLSADTLSSTQTFALNYNIINNGFFDNIEKNQGHHITKYYCYPNCGPILNISNNCGVLYGLSYTDSLGFGSSAWKDNLYISTDSTGLNSGNAILLNNYSHKDAMGDLFVRGQDLAVIPGCKSYDGILQTVFNLANVIRPLSNFPSSNNLTLPANLPAGNYYVYVWANADKGVFEFPNTNEIKRSTKPIVVKNPDLTVPTATAPSSVYGGQNFSIQYTVANNNTAGLFNALRKDKVFISNSPIYDNTAVLVHTTSYTENVLQNTPVTHTINYSFPFNTTGTKYIFIRTNTDSSLIETTLANNILAVPLSILVTTPPAGVTNDLQVSSISMADTVFTKLPMQIQYTVPNNGLGTAQGVWTDSIFVSCSPIFNPATAGFVTARQQNRTVAGGSSYTDVFTFSTDFANIINPCFPIQQFNNAYFFVKTNANNAVYEGANTNNNVLGTGLKILVNPWPDYVVTQVSSSLDTATVGRPFPASWTVKNLRYDYTTSYFFDALYFSPDSVFNNNAVKSDDDKFQARLLTQNQTYSDNFIFGTPNLPTGNYYVFLHTNYSNNIYNENTSNNTNLIRNANGSAKKIHVVQLPLPDFTDSITDAPITIAIGQPLKVKARITNSGLGANYPSNFSNRVWLNTSFNAGGYFLSGNNASIVLNPGQSYNDSITYTLPTNITAGNYILVWHTNWTNNVFETNTNNNLAFKYITVIHPTPVDLMVDNISMPDTAILGYPIPNFKWTIFNNALNSANGISSDGVYLSKSNVLDSTATLLGLNERLLQMNPLQKDTLNKITIVNNVKEDLYHVLVKTDVLNNIIETNKNNNVGLASKKLFVKVLELPLNVLKPDSLNNTVFRYYKLKIPDSLRGSTIQVTLKTNDSLTRNNQMFIGAGYVPNPANFNYAYETPNYGNQSIVMTSVNDSIYYITVRNVNSAVLQTITLKAVKLPFTILNVHSNSGGNTGNVTVKITGNLFNSTMVAKLKSGATTITASNLYFSNSTTVYATFNLAAKPLGIYDVELFKTTDSTYATLANGFSIVNANNGGLITGGGVNGIPGNGNEPGCDPNASSGLNAQLVLQVYMPQTFFIPFPFEFKVNFTNPTNVDIPAQTRVVYADQGVLMATTQAGLPNGTSSLHITITEPGGPPGIIRAGASGTLIFHAKAPNSMPGHTFVNITVK
ncbi:MAG: PKD domain-containing protein [Chitinophagaceae bacterium]|nr:PKD domain-containing protein [Chitinophagaceae bacterium]